MSLSLPIPRKSHRQVLKTDKLSIGYNETLIDSVDLLLKEHKRLPSSVLMAEVSQHF